MSNPLLHEMLARDDLPRYDLIQPAQVAAAMDTLIAEARATLARVTAPANAISWATVIEPLTDATERLGRAWGAIHHMSGVMDSPNGGKRSIAASRMSLPSGPNWHSIRIYSVPPRRWKINLKSTAKATGQYRPSPFSGLAEFTSGIPAGRC